MSKGTALLSIEGIGKTYAEKLKSIGLDTVEDLLNSGATPAGRKAIEDKSGISHAHILRWVNMSDLFRIDGIGEEYSDLLEAAGVDTVAELAQRVPENLHAKLTEINEAKNLVRRLPSLESVQGFVAQAKSLPRIVTY